MKCSSTAKSFCQSCHFYDGCADENPAPCAENIDLIATKLYKKERLFYDDATLVPKYCHNAAALFDKIAESAAELEIKRFKGRKMDRIADECDLFSKIIKEARVYNQRERSVDRELSEKLTETVERAGLHNGVIKVFGDRKKHFISSSLRVFQKYSCSMLYYLQTTRSLKNNTLKRAPHA